MPLLHFYYGAMASRFRSLASLMGLCPSSPLSSLYWPFLLFFFLGLRTTEDFRFYTASASFPEFSNKDKPLVIQYSVKHEQSLDCGGAYIKLYPAGTNQEHLNGDSKYKYVHLFVELWILESFDPSGLGPGF